MKLKNTMELKRINKFIADSGITSRRKAEELILQGRVSVNNQVVTELGYRINSDRDEVFIDGEKIKIKKNTYYLLNKPKGTVSTTSDEKNRKTVVDLIKTREKIYPIGRLDYNTTGVLLLTNDGDFSNLLTHPKNKVPKKYEVRLDRDLEKKDENKLLKGIMIDRRKGRFKYIVYINHKERKVVEVECVEGRNHFVKKMFEAFSQADGTITRRFGGTGLGLAICKQLLTMMGSELKVESQEGKGSTFYFTIPFEKAVLKEAPKVFKELRGVKALVIDDNVTNRLILCHYLDSWGLVVEQADHGNLALSMLREKNDQDSPYEIVFLDIQMQGMDGLALSRAMAKEPGLAQIPRILITSADQLKPSEKEAAGISACISKPYNQTLLHDTLLKILHTQQEPTVFEKLSQRPLDAHGMSFAGSKFSLLVVEDNVVNQKVALGQLKKLGLSADVANNGEEVVAKTAGQDYDLVLMDCQMPVMSGYEATEAIRMREKEQGLERSCIIAMTANAMAGDREKCLAVGMDDYIVKPVSLETLQTVLMQWLPARNDKRNSEVNSMTDDTHTDSLPVLDKEVVNSLKEIMEEDFEDVLREYLNESLCLLREIHEAIEQENVEVFVRASHSLKSSSANIGAMQVSAIAERLEQAGRSGRIDVEKTSLTDLNNAYDRARNALDCELQKTATIRG